MVPVDSCILWFVQDFGQLNAHRCLHTSNTYLPDVTIIASEFPKDEKAHPDYASPKAGAHWRSMCDEDDVRAKGRNNSEVVFTQHVGSWKVKSSGFN
jgi:hypothetical protein